MRLDREAAAERKALLMAAQVGGFGSQHFVHGVGGDACQASTSPAGGQRAGALSSGSHARQPLPSELCLLRWPRLGDHSSCPLTCRIAPSLCPRLPTSRQGGTAVLTAQHSTAHHSTARLSTPPLSLDTRTRAHAPALLAACGSADTLLMRVRVTGCAGGGAGADGACGGNAGPAGCGGGGAA